MPFSLMKVSDAERSIFDPSLFSCQNVRFCDSVQGKRLFAEAKNIDESPHTKAVEAASSCICHCHGYPSGAEALEYPLFVHFSSVVAERPAVHQPIFSDSQMG